MNSSVFTGIDHPAIAAEDVDKLTEWYVATLEYEKIFRNDKPVWILQAPDGTLLEIMPRDQTPRPDRTPLTPGWSHLAMRVNDLDAAIRALDEKNIQWTADAANAIGGGRVRNFVDPDGNMLQIVERPNELLKDYVS